LALPAAWPAASLLRVENRREVVVVNGLDRASRPDVEKRVGQMCGALRNCGGSPGVCVELSGRTDDALRVELTLLGIRRIEGALRERLFEQRKVAEGLGERPMAVLLVFAVFRPLPHTIAGPGVSGCQWKDVFDIKAVQTGDAGETP